MSRYLYVGIFFFLILTLLACAINARRHYKELGKAVSRLDFAFIPPILGNALIVLAKRKWLALTGCYIYFIGMDLVIYELIKFTEIYCKGTGNGRKAPKWIKWALLADAVQLIINLFTKHAFDVRWDVVNGEVFYFLQPFTELSIMDCSLQLLQSSASQRSVHPGSTGKDILLSSYR